MELYRNRRLRVETIVLAWFALAWAGHVAAGPPLINTTEPAAAFRTDDREAPEARRCLPGPWGDIEYITIVIEAPDAALPADPPEAYQRWWYFERATTQTLVRLLLDAGLAPSTAERLVAGAVPMTNTAGLAVRADDDLVVNLSDAVRQRIYAALSACDLNTAYRHPYRFESSQPQHWFADADLSAETRGLLERLVYRSGGLYLFSNPRLLLSRIPAERERRSLLRALQRQQTIVPRLRIGPTTDVDRVSAYWGARGREGDVRPLVESLRRSAVAWPINVALLLPLLPRERLFTYDPEHADVFLDCHWTSMNFFNDEPDSRFLDAAYVKRTILEHYRVVEDEPQLGDLILLRDRASQVIHSCNYLADHLVFTKNGGEVAQPWVIMTLDDVIEYYSIHEPVRATFLRRVD